MSKRKNRFRQACETGLVRMARMIIPLFPRKCILALARGLAAFAYMADRRSRKVALANLQAAMGDELSVPEMKRIARGSFRTMALLILDLFWFSRKTVSRLTRWVTFDGSFDEFFETSKAVVVGAHLGNWEVMGQALALKGHPCASVVAPLKNPEVSRILNDLRSATGQDVIQKRGAARAMIKTLREGRRVAVLLDQNTVPSDGGRFVDFFGLPVPMSEIASSLAQRIDAPVVPVFCSADGNGQYKAYALPAMLHEGRNDLTERIAGIVEKEVRAAPAKWLWMYKRWKHVPAGANIDKYPFYARRIEESESAGYETNGG